MIIVILVKVVYLIYSLETLLYKKTAATAPDSCTTVYNSKSCRDIFLFTYMARLTAGFMCPPLIDPEK